MQFNVYRDINNTYYNYYPMVRKMRLVHVEGMGYFVIQSIKEVRGEYTPHKEVVCYSAEYMLNYKPVNLAYTTLVDGGTTVYARSYKFYDKKYPDDTLTYRLFKGANFYDWSFDYDGIPDDLANKYRSFEDTGDGLYGFLQNSVSTAYDCVFTYDIENYIVHAHKKDELIRPTDIIISFDNLMKSCELEELSDDISTILSVHGSDELNLTKVNPTGTNNIYNFDYYLTEDWIGDDFQVKSVKYDENGDIVLNGNIPATETILFTEHVKLWQDKIKELIYSSDEFGSYAQLLKTYTFINYQYSLVNSYYQCADYIYNYCTEALATYIEEQNEIKKSSWTSIVIGLGMVAAVAAGVALAAFTGGISFVSMAGAFIAGGSSVAGALGLTGTSAIVASIATAAGQSIAITGLSTAFQGLLQLGTVTYQTNVTKTQMQKFQNLAQQNLNTYKSGGGYVYNLTAESFTNIIGGQYNEFVADEPLYWVSNTIDYDNEELMYQRIPSDSNVQSGVQQIWCLDVLEKKIIYVQEKIKWYVDIYSYENWFSSKEKQILEPFLIQADYTDESFVATDDIDIEDATDMSQYVVTNQGQMTLEEYHNAVNGYYIRYLCGGTSSNPTIDYEATPIIFDQNKFRTWLTQQTIYSDYADKPNKISGNFYIYYDGQYWTISRIISDSDDNEIINQIRSTFPTACGISQDTHDGNYKYTPKVGDYILLNLYNDELEVIDTISVAMQLAQQGYDILEECSKPAFSFNITCNNFMLLEEYKEWTEQIGFDGSGLTLGSMITVLYENGIIFEPFIQEVSFEYDNPDSLSFTFGSKFNLGTSEYTLGKILSNNTSSVQRVTRSLIGKTSSLSSTWSSGNTISSINDNINSSIDRLDPVIEGISDSLEEQKQDIENLNGELDSWLDEYKIDKENIENKFDFVDENFNNYTGTTEMVQLIDMAKQQALEQAAIDAKQQVDDNNNGFITNLWNQITGQQDADREAAQKAAEEAYNNSVAETNRVVEEYYNNLQITYDKLDQQIKDILDGASDALNKANAIIEESLQNWDAVGTLVAGGMGLYSTKIVSGANGGVKLAFHNEKTLEESNIIWYVTSNGIVWTSNANGVTINNIDEQAKYWESAISAGDGGSMVINNIKAHKITGELIAADTITSNNILAGSIIGKSIAADAITGDKIVAGSIYARNLAKDAVFALCWVGSSSSMSSSTVTGNRTVSSPSGGNKRADFNDYTGILVFSRNYGGSSCIVVQGQRASLWEPISTSTKTPWATYSIETIGYRYVELSGSYVYISSAQIQNWDDWMTSGAYSSTGGTIVGIMGTGHRHYTGGGLQFTTASSSTEQSLAVPRWIYGFILGT